MYSTARYLKPNFDRQLQVFEAAHKKFIKYLE